VHTTVSESIEGPVNQQMFVESCHAPKIMQPSLVFSTPYTPQFNTLLVTSIACETVYKYMASGTRHKIV